VSQSPGFLSPFFKASQSLFAWDWAGTEADSMSKERSSYEALRVQTFKLESLGRIFKRASKKDPELRTLGTHIKDRAKFIEDTIGQYLYIVEMDAAFDQQKRPETFRFELDKRVGLAADKLASQAHLCLGASYELEGLLESLLLGDRDLRKSYLKGLTKNLSRIQKKIKDIDPEKLEDGTHELRRQLRWVIMGVVYANDLFFYKNKETLGSQKKYLSLSGSARKGALVLNAEPLVMLSESVGLLGQVKDMGLEEHFFSGFLSPHQGKDINESFLEAIQATERVLELCESTRPLEHLIQQIRQQS